MITVGIDARTWFFRSGLGRYCRNVVAALAEEPDCRVVAWLSCEKRLEDFPAGNGRIETRISAAPLGSAELERSIFKAQVDSSAIDVFLSPYSPVPPALRMPSLQTIHDLSTFRFPDLHLAETVQYLETTLPESIASSAALIADSSQTARDIEFYFPEAAHRTWVVPLGVESRFLAAAEPDARAAILARYGLAPQRYVLYVGNIEPRKNLLTAIDAYARSSLSPEIPFVLAGALRWGSEQLQARLERGDVAGCVRLLDFVDDTELPLLYQGALCFVYPSLYEGYGLPVVEAMASGTAVISSNAASLPEVVGDAGLLFDPLDVDALRRALDLLAHDAPLREDLALRGSLRARTYTWQRTAQRILWLAQQAAAGDLAAAAGGLLLLSNAAVSAEP